MSLSADLALVERALDAIERREVRVLVWGLVDAALSASELDEALNDVLSDPSNQCLLTNSDCRIVTADDLRAKLTDGALLIEVPGRPGSSTRYRTRMAEGVRLFARLRQLFPGKHNGRDGWMTASTLVADYRLLWRPRRYPSRDLTTVAAMEKIRREVNSTEIISAAEHWFGQGDATWKWAKFQIDATTRVLSGLEQDVRRGTIVSAGTGSGKTLAFYLPALSWLAARKRVHPNSRGVRILAIYPRNELLKDQLAEVFDQARKFDNYLGQAGAAGISVGVLYGGTPTSVNGAARDWREANGSCPFFRCPTCRSEMRLQQHNGVELDARLVCRACGVTVDGRQLRISRRSMQSDPPDVLFASVEMLNQRMSDSTMRHLFGIGPKAQFAPPLMLLDEVHVYAGTYGAQVAHLLRRWSELTKRRTSFVGLSATIAEGKSFFASLVSLDPETVEEISPATEDMIEEGAEYMLALRGDPVSQASLLSTSIQALLLASRLVDRREDLHGKERPFAGWRTFAFTDQVDATNRLFYDLRDAEGFTQRGHPATNRHPNGGLAHMRMPGPSLRRYEGGQDWRLANAIGHDLAQRHRVERTTAYDTGVDQNSPIVVATAALEVGYDDPAVGVVLQHKAPRDMAQFLQRKGRAGRTRHMRPWTIMVLSDYGRDRLAYQAYEQFFDPELPPRDLPLSNRYIRRMQATYALIDYLGVQMQTGEPAGSIWRDLAGPQTFPAFHRWPAAVKDSLRHLVADKRFPLASDEWQRLRRQAYSAAPLTAGPHDRWQGVNRIQNIIRRRREAELLRELLDDPDRAEAFASHVGLALGLPREEVEPLLWDHPRPLFLGAIPTALRRVLTDWSAHGILFADRSAGSPLPEYAPATLFSDLSLPEVGLVPLGAAQPVTYLPVLQALSEFAPGKVSRRLDTAYWLGPTQDQLVAQLDSGQTEVLMDIEDWFHLDPQPPFDCVDAGRVLSSEAYRPLDLRLKPTPRLAPGNRPEVLDKSNARLLWRSQIVGRRPGAIFESPSQRIGIARLVSSVAIHTHASQSQATVRRYAIGSKVELRIRRGNLRVDRGAIWRFERQSRPCGIGFEIEVDALCFKLNLPSSPASSIRDANLPVQRAVRSARYIWEAQHGDALASLEDNTFLRGWLAQIFQVAAVQLAVERNCPLEEALDKLGGGTETQRLDDVLTTTFQSLEAGEGVDDDAPPDVQAEPRLRTRLMELLARVDVVVAIRNLGRQALTDPIDDRWDLWLTQAMTHTLGAALLEAIQHTCPQVDTEELIVDVDPGPMEDGTVRDAPELWISESNPGGNGLVEQLVGALATDATQFYRRVEAALGQSEFEIIDAQLRQFQQWVGAQPIDTHLRALVSSIREAQSSREAHEQLALLRRSLIERGQAVFHGYLSALSTRMLRSGTPPELDELLAELIRRWGAIEDRLGVEVDGRVVCALFSTDQRLDQAFVAAGFDLPAVNRKPWRFSVLTGIIWARGHALRASALPLSTRFSDRPAVTDRLILLPWLSPAEAAIRTSDPDWLVRLHARLTSEGRATVAVTPPGDDALNAAMASIVTVPVQLEYLNVYPKLLSATRQGGEVHLHLSLEATA